MTQLLKNKMLKPDYLLEVSWEICNKVGGIYTVIATKSLYLNSQFGNRHIMLGPDLWTDGSANPDFIEDSRLYESWKENAALQGLQLRIGRWNIPGQPVAVLVDYRKFVPEQNEILARLWRDFGVDSLTGDWDYRENALFGYAAGKVIESFYKYNIRHQEKVLAQFHEWQTGAGLLWLRSQKVPVATVFTTHATMMGRCICGNRLPLYGCLEQYDGDKMAERLGVISRYSLEKKSSMNAHVFTTVSEITARECRQFNGRAVDFVTPNGFENSFTPSNDIEYSSKREAARMCLLRTASLMCGGDVPQDSVLVGIGGRYEYNNKGIDVFIDALASLRNSDYDGRQIQAFIMIPSGHSGPQRHFPNQVSHVLMNPAWDQISVRLREVGLHNALQDKIKVYFIPSYLNGSDGVLNMSYYDLLIGLDATFFPSYYEPWGYTPLESLAFGVPTLTTSLAGFGQWVRDYYKDEHPGIAIVDRDDGNYGEVVAGVEKRLREIAALDYRGELVYRNSAKEVSKIALWKNQIVYYQQAYSLALEKLVGEQGAFPAPKEGKRIMQFNKIEVDAPSWKSVMVTRHLPEELSGLETLCKNLWWCWNDNAKALFKSIDSELWHNSGHNPMVILDKVSIKKFNVLAKDGEFLGRLNAVMQEFNAYMSKKNERTDPSVAYFCMEYGLDSSLKIYSGGLGILAGDYLKETSDMNVNLVAVGLLYRYGYFTQKLSAQGDQVATYESQNFLRIPAEPVYDADGNWITAGVDLPGRVLTARIWKVAVGRTDLYLLDADYEANLPEDRQVTYYLYGGDWENRLKQEILLGVGGIRALRALGLNPRIYHCNEGHAAFTGLERLSEYIQRDGLDYSEALEVVRASSLFTTHTPVPAGHDAFEENMIRDFLGNYAARLKVDWETFMSLGKNKPLDQGEKFSMSKLAANISQNVNGVSMLHGKVSQEIFADMYPGYLPEELYISYVTNGVHYPTWAAKEWKELHSEVFGPEFRTSHYDKTCFEGVYRLSDEQIWNVRKKLKEELVETVNERLSDPQQGSHYSPGQIVKIQQTLRDDILTIGFARRFATYKRATLLFSDLERLDAIVNNPNCPVQFLFAGKAHPADKAGQDLIKQIIEISKQPRFLGKIVFVPGYDINLAKRLVQGVDVWLNNPTRPQEASGTSGEKAAMNGVMHFSVLDGWWVEGYKKGAGWALPMEQTYEDWTFQNELDSATIYNIIEKEIAPDYYDFESGTDRSPIWISHIKNTIAQVASNFTTNRMLEDYCNQYYIPQDGRIGRIVAEDYRLAREIAAWKKRVRQEWNNIQVVSYQQPDSSYTLSSKNMLGAEVVLNLAGLSPDDIGVEMLFTNVNKKGIVRIREKVEFSCVEFKDGVAKYEASILPERTGMYQVATRIYPKNSELPHRQDFPLVKWL